MVWKSWLRTFKGDERSGASVLEQPVSAQPARWHVVCDPFSWCGWEPEGAVRIEGPDRDPEAWERQVRQPPESSLLLVESVWEDFYQTDKFFQLTRLIQSFRREGIPVLFWAKEDPPHFQEFLQLALLCDTIATTDEDSIPGYREAGFKGAVELMTFPAQPRIHRPYLPKDPAKKVFFAGAGRFSHPDRAAALQYLIRPALALGCTDIFARRNLTIDRAAWPEDCQRYIVGELPYEDLLREYSRYALGLSVASAPYSPTMYPRRIVELPMADVLVISDNCRAVRRYFPEIPTVQYSRQATDAILYFLKNAEERKQRLEVLKKRILEKHTYAQAIARLRSLVR